MPAAIRRGEVVTVDFNATEGQPIRKTRPALIVQNDVGNAVSPMTIVAAVHHDVRKGLPIHVAVPAGTAGLTKDSVVDCGILYTLRQTELGNRLGRLNASLMEQVDRALRVSLGLR